MIRTTAYYSRVKKLSQGLHGPTVAQLKFRQGAARANLAGCACDSAVRSTRLQGYRSVRLNGYKLVTAVRTGLSGVGSDSAARSAKPVVALLPISDRKAVQAAVLRFARADIAKRTLSGLGSNSEQASGAASGAAAGAKVGSIVPGIGTVIGAVVGAVAGWLAGKPKPVRASAAQVAECRALLTEYESVAAQSPDAPIPMEWGQILNLNWCYMAVYGAETLSKDPRFFNVGFEGLTKPLALDLVKKVYETPVGATVDMAQMSVKDRNGKNVSFRGLSFANPVFSTLKNLANGPLLSMDAMLCGDNAGKGAGGCITNKDRALWRRILFDLLGWAARTTLPNISESDLRAASQVAATLPNTSAKDVVSAVEQILARPVVREETAALLTPQAAVPGAPAVPIIPTATLAPIVTQVQAAAPDTALAPTTAPLDPFANLPTAGSNAAQSLVPVASNSAPVQPGAPAQPVSAGLSNVNPWLLGGLALVGIVFATARPMRARRR